MTQTDFGKKFSRLLCALTNLGKIGYLLIPAYGRKTVPLDFLKVRFWFW